MKKDSKRNRDESTLAEINDSYAPKEEHFPDGSSVFWQKFQPDYTREGHIARTVKFTQLDAEIRAYMSDAIIKLKKKKSIFEKEMKAFAQERLSLLKAILKETPEFDETSVATITRLIDSLEDVVRQSEELSVNTLEIFFLRLSEELKYPNKKFWCAF